jgi:hypothetical protein
MERGTGLARIGNVGVVRRPPSNGGNASALAVV